MIECRRTSTFSRSASSCAFPLRTNVEADDDCVRGRSQQDVRLGNRADTGVQHANPNLLGRHVLQILGNNLDRTLHISLDDDVEVLDARHLDLFRKSFERDPRALGKLCFAFLHLAVLRNALGLVAIRHHKERIPRHPACPRVRESRPGVDGPASVIGRPRSSNIARIFPNVLPTM